MRKVKLGLDMGGTNIKMALVESEGELIKKHSIDATSGLSMEERLEDIVGEINVLLGSEYELQGIGIAFPGIVDYKNAKILSKYVKYPNAHNVELRAWAWEHWKVPLVIENDARAALIGEWRYGAGQGSENLLMVTLGTGMGSAVLLEGQLLRGNNFLAGNLGGHMSIDFEGDLCNCGNIGCVETAGSSWALKSNFHKIEGYERSSLSTKERLDFKSVFEAASMGDKVAGELKTKSLKAWSAGIVNLLHAYDPERVVIGGGIMESKDQIIPFIQQSVRSHSWLPDGRVLIVPATQTRSAGILGICHLLSEEFKLN